MPSDKSLFGKNNERGLPIGNLTSQFWGNVYLNELDHFIKRELKCRHYLRYVDDVVLLAENGGYFVALVRGDSRVPARTVKTLSPAGNDPSIRPYGPTQGERNCFRFPE